MIATLSIRAPLLVPGHRPELFAEATRAGADGLIIDLHETVPESEKAQARRNLRTCVTSVPLMVRINCFDTIWHKADLEVALGIRPDAVLIPRSEDLDRIGAIGAWVPTVPIIETAKGLTLARKIARLPGIACLSLGTPRPFMELARQGDGRALDAARRDIVQASNLAAIAGPLDAAFSDIMNLQQVRIETLAAMQTGMCGRICTHPDQVAVVDEVFRPASIGQLACA